MYVIEVNPRGSRTVPFLSKVTGVPMVDLAVRVGLGQNLAECGFGTGLWPAQPLVAAKAPVFSMSKLTQVDTYLGPEMKSTGEVMGLGTSVNEALGKALLAAGSGLSRPGSAVLLSLADRDKAEAMPLLQRLGDLGYDLLATEGTARAIRDGLGLPVDTVTKKLNEGHPNVLDAIASGRVSAVVNTVDRRPAPVAGRVPDPPRGCRTPHSLLHQPRHAARRARWTGAALDGRAPHGAYRGRIPWSARQCPKWGRAARDTRPGGAYSGCWPR